MSAKRSDDDSAPCGDKPASSCLVAQADFSALRRDVAQIKLAICGDDEMGHTGLIRRQMTLAELQNTTQAKVANIEIELLKEKERRKTVVWLAGAVSAVVTFSLPLLNFLASIIKKTPPPH